MAFLIFLFFMYLWVWWGNHAPRPIPTARTGTWWKVTFKAKRTPPLEIEGDSEPLVLRALMAQKINYKDILLVERIP